MGFEFGSYFLFKFVSLDLIETELTTGSVWHRRSYLQTTIIKSSQHEKV